MDHGGIGVDSRQGQEICLFSTASRAARGYQLSSYPKVEEGAISSGVKLLESEADYSRLSSAEV
jgi:hypothetical protein